MMACRYQQKSPPDLPPHTDHPTKVGAKANAQVVAYNYYLSDLFYDREYIA